MKQPATDVEFTTAAARGARPVLFRWAVGLSILGCISAIAWIVYRSRHTLEAHWYWYKWTHAASEKEQTEWRDRFFSEPSLVEKIAVAVGSADRETPRQTYWIVTGRAAKSHDSLVIWARLFVAEVAHDPDLLRLRLHALRWTPPSRRPTHGPAASGDFVAETDKMLRDAAESELLWPDLQAVLPFLEVCGLTGRSDLARGTNESNWRERYQWWHQWYEEHCRYLRWDDALEVLVVDETAHREQRPVVAKLRQIPATKRPLPGWTGDDPE